MTGTITKVHEIKRSRNGNSYIRIEFEMEDKTWAKTDVCPGFRNYKNWQDKMVVGLVLTNLAFRSKSEITADSVPKICE